ncbi:MAG: hypothetical protein ABSB84_09770 [Verrucomicrobiota bacterium]
MTGWLGSGTTHAKLVPEPMKRVSMTSLSVPLEKQINARWSGIVTLAGYATVGITMPSANAASGRNKRSKNSKIRCILAAGLSPADEKAKQKASPQLCAFA